jgi:hypothetical protein
MKIQIKNMNCPAAKYFVKFQLERQGLIYDSIEMGEVELKFDISQEQMKTLKMAILQFGLEITEVKPDVESFFPLVA